MKKIMLFFIMILMINSPLLAMFNELGEQAIVGQNNFEIVTNVTPQELVSINSKFKLERDTAHLKHRVLSCSTRKYKADDKNGVAKTIEYERITRSGCLGMTIEQRVTHSENYFSSENNVVNERVSLGPIDSLTSCTYTTQAKIFGSALGAAAIGVIGYVAAQVM